MNDDLFMTQFSNRLKLEPRPEWMRRKKKPFPWLEIAWAGVAALMLGMYWAPLRFGAVSVVSKVGAELIHVPTGWLFAGLAVAATVVSVYGSAIRRFI